VVDAVWLATSRANFDIVRKACPHSRVQSTGNFVILLKARAASEDLRKPELTNGTLHVANLALRGSRRLDPLRWLTANTAYHVGMCESLGSTLLGLVAERRGNWLRDTGVQRRGTARNQEVVSTLITSAGSALAIAGPWPGEGRVCVE
jgi:hypothetical protein